MQFGQLNGMYSMPMDRGLEMNATFQEQQAPTMSQTDSKFDSMDFESAFEAANQDWLESERQLDELMSDNMQSDMPEAEVAQFDIRTDRVPAPFVEQDQRQQEQIVDPKEESDALARTAGELLDSVSHDTSDKFAKSSFLALMRQLRDKELRVDGENFINASPSLP
jgi:alpha-galactosidase/6-phospho-beta-glucosidase family protein